MCTCLLNALFILQGAIILTFGSSSPTAGTSVGVADRIALMTVMAGQVSLMPMSCQ